MQQKLSQSSEDKENCFQKAEEGELNLPANWVKISNVLKHPVYFDCKNKWFSFSPVMNFLQFQEYAVSYVLLLGGTLLVKPRKIAALETFLTLQLSFGNHANHQF